MGTLVLYGSTDAAWAIPEAAGASAMALEIDDYWS